MFQHLDVEHPGIFRDFWHAKGHSWDVVELDLGEPIPDFTGYDMLAVMGGPMDVWQEDLHPWLTAEKAAIRRWVCELGRPYLGICLGHQLLAAALGGRVGMMAKPEVGIANVHLTEAGAVDPVVGGLPRSFETLQWHGAEVQALPEGAVVLASNEACAVQAFRWGAYAYGFQFHTEVTSETIPLWRMIPEYRASLEQALGTHRAAELDSRVALKLTEFERAARHLDDRFAEIAAMMAT
ncbi:GMP synthase-like glutamine amidotransferase [Methylobacterium brachythecii]|uniref:GMP synthase-like glutamine amidotransferase n=1 Tax=Methylobacterium brachythecii TaxID=1176177 RepID=A0A7W6AH78_9HYPH|nr:GMP synthase-like glutamine amidotransferase [Methylobacterium brachythecii]